MKKLLYIISASGLCAALYVPAARAYDAAVPGFKLPYPAGQSFVVVQGYHSPPTHIKKDGYALDLTQDGCDAYGKSTVAAAAGRVIFASETGYNGGYGTEVLVSSDGDLVARYAHMIPDSLAVAKGESVAQGETIGRIGDTGLVAGEACAAHPGTHLHFAVDRIMPDGTYAAYDAEPISGYSHIIAGSWYLSDNTAGSGQTASVGASGNVLGTSTTSTNEDIPDEYCP